MTRNRLWLNSVAMNDLDPRLVVQSITENVPDVNRPTTAKWGGGTHMGPMERKSMQVAVAFSIAVPRDLAARVRILAAVTAWAAQGGVLEVGHRPDQRLRVDCIQPPTIGNVAAWNGTLGVMFQANEIPWWESIRPQTVEGKATSTPSTVTARADGTTDSTMELTIKNTGTATCYAVTVNTQGGLFALTGLGLARGETLTVAHDSAGRMTIQIAGTSGSVRSVYDKRTTNSLDEMMVSPGDNTIRISTDTPTTYTLTTRGRWL